MCLRSCTEAEDRAHIVVVLGRPAKVRPAGLGFSQFCLIFGILVPATTTHPKLISLVRNRQNMYGTYRKAHVIPEKLTVKIGNNGRQQPPKVKLLLVLKQSRS